MYNFKQHFFIKNVNIKKIFLLAPWSFKKFSLLIQGSDYKKAYF